MRRMIHLAAACLAVLVGLAGSVLGATITYEFSGTITDAFDETDSGIVAVGNTFFGRFVYDTSTPDWDPSPNLGWYWHVPPLGVNGISVQIGSTFSYSLPQGADWIVSAQRYVDKTGTGLWDTVSNQFVERPTSIPLFPTVVAIQGDINLRGPYGIFNDDSIPTSINLSSFVQDRSFHIGGVRPAGDGGFYSVFDYRGTIESLTQVAPDTSVPEPTTLLVWSGLAGLGAVISYRRKRVACRISSLITVER